MTVAVALSAAGVDRDEVALAKGLKFNFEAEGYSVDTVGDGPTALDRLAAADPPFDLVVLDLQIGNMGGLAACMDLRLEQRAGRIPLQRVVLLLDRDADVFLARQAEADAWMVKPLDPLALRRTAAETLAAATA